MGRVSEPFVSEILDACALGRGQRLLLLRGLCSLGSSVRLAALLTTAGSREVHIQPVHRPVRWASFAEYGRVIEGGGGLAGREYRTLPASARPAVRKEVERAVAGRRDGRGLAWQVEATCCDPANPWGRVPASGAAGPAEAFPAPSRSLGPRIPDESGETWRRISRVIAAH
jgi:hypothetical protein